MHFIQIFLEEVLNPLLVIAFGLFVGIGYILTQLYPVSIEDWVTLIYVCVAVAAVGLVARIILNWKRYSFKGFF